ncbi:MAG TPA: MFS transporter, partial [Agromyces sp.]
LGSRFGALAGRVGPRILMTLGPLVVAAGWLLTLGVDLPVDYWWQVFPGMVVVGLGMAMTVAPLTAAILGAVDPARAGIGSAVNNAVARIAGLVAIASIGVIVAERLDVGGYHRVAVATAVLLVVGGAVSWVGIRNPAPPADDAAQPATSAETPASEERPRS